MINVGVIGCGYWGPNHVRIFSQIAGSQTLMAADLDEAKLNKMKELYPSVEVTKNYQDLLKDPRVDAVCIAAPTKLHYQITLEALAAGKHVLCEKPLALTPEECQDLKQRATAAKRVLMVGHIFVFNAGIIWLKDYLKSGELGKVFYAYAARTNLGPFRYDVNAWWDLAPHDISIFNYLLDAAPVSVSARAHKCLGNSLEDLAFATLEYPDNRMVNIHVSWVDPRKVRQITLVGEKSMVLWDDLDNLGPIRVYDKHVEKTSAFYATYGEFQLLSREGSIMIPKVGVSEPLKAQAQYFIDCVRDGRSPDVADAQKGLDVVKTLCAAQKSIELKGQSVEVRE
ncbi:MAG: Gfo/Idh/MocA family oxidoreductase [Candidatus Omnitrophica bacterium]|nr:Gfo/Idh/MocA family oxidoreductase [Candidatus Omnitrophota bacterium]